MPRRRSPAPRPSAISQWWSVFPDPDLQALIRTALAQNYDLRVAVPRILQAQSQVTLPGSLQYPTVDGSVSAPYTALAGSDLPARCRTTASCRRRARRRVGAGLLGQVPAQHRVRAGRAARRRGRPLRGHGDAGRRGRPGLSDPARAGPDAGDLQAHRDFADAVGRPGAGPAGRRRGRDSRPAPGRDALLRRDEDDPRVPASDRGDRELHQHPARAESGPDPARAAARPAGRRPEPCRRACRRTC